MRPLLLALVAVASPVLAQDDAPWMPLAPNSAWTWRVAGTGERVRVQVGGSFRLEIVGSGAPGAVDARQLVGLSDRPAYAASTERGVLLAMTRPFGDGGDPAVIAIADLRWEDEAWEFSTANGCVGWTVTCRRSGIEPVEVPAGTFECLRLEIGPDQTFWLARGVGIVRWRDGTSGTEVVRELESTD